MSDFKNRFADALARCLAANPLYASGAVPVHVIMNPMAGGLRRGYQRRQLLALAEACAPAAAPLPIQIHATTNAEEARNLAAILARSATAPLLIISVGGDGTHNEVLTGLMDCPLALRRHATVFRFPAGTGNDGADAWNAREALECLRDGKHRGRVGAVRVQVPGLGQHYAFNVASCGLDAWVVHFTNILKRWIPGSFYRLIADIGVLLYLGGMPSSHIALGWVPDQSEVESDGVHGLLAFGVSGFRTYGHGIWVLPREGNVCAIRRGNLRENLGLKRHFYHASHTTLPGVVYRAADEAVMHTLRPLYVQVDGDVLERPAQTVRFSLVDTGLACLSAKDTAGLFRLRQDEAWVG